LAATKIGSMLVEYGLERYDSDARVQSTVDYWDLWCVLNQQILINKGVI